MTEGKIPCLSHADGKAAPKPDSHQIVKIIAVPQKLINIVAKGFVAASGGFRSHFLCRAFATLRFCVQAPEQGTDRPIRPFVAPSVGQSVRIVHRRFFPLLCLDGETLDMNHQAMSLFRAVEGNTP